MFAFGKKSRDRRDELFVQSRDEAIRSLNKAKIEAWIEKNHAMKIAGDDWVFWTTVCKMGSAIAGIHISEWLMYAEWLDRNGSVPLCDRWREAAQYKDSGGVATAIPKGADIPYIINKEK